MSEGEPRNWKPKLLAFEEGRDLYDYQMIKRDLKFARSCFEQISKNEYGVIFASQGYTGDKAGATDWCTFVAGAIYYRRCFKSGVRVWLRRDQIVSALNGDQLALHDALIDIADKHIAHSVNEMELGCTTIEVSVDATGRIHKGGIGWRGSGVGPMGPAGYRAICYMIAAITDGPLSEKIALLEKAVLDRIDRMTDAEIMQLPEGFAPHIDMPRYGKSRRWPTHND